MKKFMKAVLGFVILFVMMCVTMLATSCSDVKKFFSKTEACDSVKVVDIVNSAIQPVFTDFDVLDIYRDEFIKRRTSEQIFIELPTEVYEAVAKVCFKKYGSITIQELIDEYIEHKDVYDNLPYKSTANETAPPAQKINIDSIVQEHLKKALSTKDSTHIQNK